MATTRARLFPPLSRWTWAEWVTALVPVVLTAAALIQPRPLLFVSSIGRAFLALVVPLMILCAITQWVVAPLGRRIQGERKKNPALMRLEALETARAMYVIACIIAWPLTMSRMGEPTGLVWTVDEAGGSWWFIALQFGFGVVAVDAWTYLKHRLLHTRLLFGFHKQHHAFRDPTAFAGFAVSPVETVLTFWPIWLLCFPWMPHYGPVYFALVIGFVFNNLYLHSGVTFAFIERWWPRIGLNTSAWHNVHHARATTHFGEVSFVWDVLLGTYAEYPWKPDGSLRDRG